MARVFRVDVNDRVRSSNVVVALAGMQAALGLASTNLSKGRSVVLTPVDWAPTHRTAAAAQAAIDVDLFQLTPSNEGEQA